MECVIVGVVCFFLGGLTGVIAMALCVAAGKSDSDG